MAYSSLVWLEWRCWTTTATAFSLLVLTEQPRLTRLFLKKSRVSLPCPVQSRSENALRGNAPGIG